MKTMNFTLKNVINSASFLFLCLVFSAGAYAAAPGAPTNVVAAPAGASATSAKIYFTAPASNGGTTITSYTATSSPGGLTGTYTGSGSNSITVTGLTTGTTYTFTVTCTNGTVSPASAPTGNVTPTAFTSVSYSGAAGGDWATATNWTPNGVPTIACDVTIPSAKSVVIAAGTIVNINSLTFTSSGATVTNNGTLNIVPLSDGKNAMSFTSGTFTNDSGATLNVNASSNFGFCAGLGGSVGSPNTLTLNGTISFTASTMTYQSCQYLFNVFANSNSIFAGAGFTVGSSSSPVGFGVFRLSGGITINSGFNFTYYGQTGSYNPIYMGSNSSVSNSGNISLTSIPVSGTGLGTAINTYEGSNQTAVFNNYGTLSGTGWDYFMSMSGGTPTVIPWGTNTLNNTGTLTVSSCNSGIVGYTSTVNNITNSGTMNIACNTSGASAIKMGTNAAVVGAMTQSNGTLTNTGTITITKGVINGTSTDVTKYANIANNAGGIINFNFGATTGSATTAVSQALLTNSGGTINGTCTFPASTFASSTGTLSPGDNGVGIGIIVLTPPTLGTAYVLTGNLNIQVNGKTIAGTDYDKLVCSELDVTAASLIMSLGYSSAKDDKVQFGVSTTAAIGEFLSAALPNGWIVEYAPTSYSLKCISPTAVHEVQTLNAKVYADANNIHVNFTEINSAIVELVSLEGKILKNVKIEGLNNTIPTNNLRGIFIVNIRTHNLLKEYKVTLK